MAPPFISPLDPLFSPSVSGLQDPYGCQKVKGLPMVLCMAECGEQGAGSKMEGDPHHAFCFLALARV